MQALFDLWIEAFFHENPHVQHAINSSLEKITDAYELSDDTNKQGAIMKATQDLLVNIESMNLLKRLIDFDKRKKTSPIYTYLRVYMRGYAVVLKGLAQV